MAKMCVRELRTEDPSVSVFYLAFVSSIAAIIGCSLPASLISPPAGMSLLGFIVPRNLTETAMLVGVGACCSSRPELADCSCLATMLRTVCGLCMCMLRSPLVLKLRCYFSTETCPAICALAVVHFLEGPSLF